MTEIITLKAGKAAGYHQPQADEYGDDRIAPLVPKKMRFGNTMTIVLPLALVAVQQWQWNDTITSLRGTT